MLPGIDGFECIRRLRRADDVPIVVISARATRTTSSPRWGPVLMTIW
jgi:DNA-binding response OmpR family regulator